MPRKTGTTAVTEVRTPYEKGPTIIDAEGDSITEDDIDALRVYPIGDDGESMTDVHSTSQQVLNELKRIRKANEIMIDQLVDVPDD